jgi:hypothetical protein
LVYSLLMDYTQCRYRHRRTGLLIPWHQRDQDATDPHDWPRVEGKFGRVGIDDEFLAWFASEFEYVGPLSIEEFQANIEWLSQTVAPNAQLFFINAVELPIDNPGEPDRHVFHRQMNDALDSVVHRLPNAHVCDVRTIVLSEKDLSKQDLRHYHRHVYKGIAERLRQLGLSNLALVSPEPVSEPEEPSLHRAPSHVGRYVRGAIARILRS